MVKDRLLLDDVIEGVPATWHRNTFSPNSSPAFGTSRSTSNQGRNCSIPTQLVYPNGSFNVGVNVDSIRTNHNHHHYHQGCREIGGPSSEDGEQSPLVVYTSPKVENMGNTLLSHMPLMLAWLFYVVLALGLIPRLLRHPDATDKSRKFVWICLCAIVDIVVLMSILWKFGYHDVMRLNTTFLLVIMVSMALYMESVFSIALFAAHCLMVITTNYSLGKCTAKVFIISEM